jgi:asparagine synthase (glutamine-hydrolysing)
MLSELDRALDRELFSYTYDANPVRGGNPEIARRIAEVKDTPLEEVPITPDAFVDVVEHAVDLVDGMLPWNSLKNISAVFNVENDDPGVILEAAGQGELLGEHPLRYQVTDCESAVESMYLSETPALGTPERVTDLLAFPVDPRASFEEVARNSDETAQSHVVLDAHFRNHYGRFVYASNHVARSRVGMRVPFADREFLNHVARMPPKFRLGTAPFSGGLILYGTSRPKLRLIRSLDAELAAIPYQRTRLPPSYPYPAHIASYVVTNGFDYLRGESVLGGATNADEWLRDHPGMRELIGGYVDDACERPLFEGDAVRELHDEHLREVGNHSGLIAAITTLEMWLQRRFDD